MGLESGSTPVGRDMEASKTNLWTNGTVTAVNHVWREKKTVILLACRDQIVTEWTSVILGSLGIPNWTLSPIYGMTQVRETEGKPMIAS